MPTELGLEFYPEKEMRLPAFTGHIARGVLLHMLRHVNPALASELHEPHLRKPYAVTPLRFKAKAKTPQGYAVDPTAPCELRCRFLDDAHASHVISFLGEKGGITVMDASLRLSRITVRVKDYRQLEAESAPVEAFRLVFRSPTYLAALGREFYSLFPEPSRIFPNLMRLWSQHSTGRKFSRDDLAEYREWLQRKLGVTGYALETRRVAMGKKTACGFMGWAIYRARERDEWSRVTAMLARFAEFSNVGGNRTGGFGVVSFQPKPEKPPTETSGPRGRSPE